TSRFRVAGMDCAAEEQLVRMSLDGIAGIESTYVDLDVRTVTVTHRTDVAVIRVALDALNLNTTQLEESPDTRSVAGGISKTDERRALAIALAINAVFFGAEMAAGILGNSMGLVADSLDMFADASVYALSLIAVGGSAARKRRLAAGSGYMQLALAFAGLIEVTRRFVTSEMPPNVVVMIIVAALALAGNVATLLVLKRARSPEAHFQAAWIFTANDIKVNALVIAAAIVVAFTGSPAPDLLAGAVIFFIVANGARRILALAR
ncbi:cation transporter, partial [Actinomycetota bacterium]